MDSFLLFGAGKEAEEAQLLTPPTVMPVGVVRVRYSNRSSAYTLGQVILVV